MDTGVFTVRIAALRFFFVDFPPGALMMERRREWNGVRTLRVVTAMHYRPNGTGAARRGLAKAHCSTRMTTRALSAPSTTTTDAPSSSHSTSRCPVGALRLWPVAPSAAGRRVSHGVRPVYTPIVVCTETHVYRTCACMQRRVVRMGWVYRLEDLDFCS